MIRLRPSAERGQADHGWLKAKFSFSFADYHDAEFTQFSVLRVLNEDRVEPQNGFGTHPHRDMEILTWVLDGELHHRDSTGMEGSLKPGEMQHMSAGRGVLHSEMNDSPDTPVHVVQIWLLPRERGITPSYEQRTFPMSERQGRLRLLASPDGADGSLTIQQDATLSVANLDLDDSVRAELAADRHAWLQVTRGAIALQLGDGPTEGIPLNQGDGVAISEERLLTLRATEDGSEVLVFDLP